MNGWRGEEASAITLHGTHVEHFASAVMRHCFLISLSKSILYPVTRLYTCLSAARSTSVSMLVMNYAEWTWEVIDREGECACVMRHCLTGGRRTVP
jgi:hypothetical protein